MMTMWEILMSPLPGETWGRTWCFPRRRERGGGGRATEREDHLCQEGRGEGAEVLLEEVATILKGSW